MSVPSFRFAGVPSLCAMDEAPTESMSDAVDALITGM